MYWPPRLGLTWPVEVSDSGSDFGNQASSLGFPVFLTWDSRRRILRGRAWELCGFEVWIDLWILWVLGCLRASLAFFTARVLATSIFFLFLGVRGSCWWSGLYSASIGLHLCEVRFFRSVAGWAWSTTCWLGPALDGSTRICRYMGPSQCGCTRDLLHPADSWHRTLSGRIALRRDFDLSRRCSCSKFGKLLCF